MNRLLFEKTDDAVFLSHLDLMRVFQRAFRRAGMLLKHSQGFTPHAYVSILLPLPVGVSSACEILDFELDPSDQTPLEQVPQKLNCCLPSGVRIVKFYRSDRKAKELAYLRASVTLEYDYGVPRQAPEAIAQFLNQDEILVEKTTKGGKTVQQDIKQMLPSCTLDADENTITLRCVVCAQNPSLNPMQLVKAIERYLPAYAPDFATCHRLAFLDRCQNPFA